MAARLVVTCDQYDGIEVSGNSRPCLGDPAVCVQCGLQARLSMFLSGVLVASSLIEEFIVLC